LASNPGCFTAPDPGFQPPELNGRLGTVDIFTATPADDLGTAKPDTTLTAELSGDMTNYNWKINGRAFADTQPLIIRQGQRATLTFSNTTTMWHPMHLHGHTFQVINPTAPRAHVKTPSSCCRSRKSASTRSPTTQASG